MKVKKKYFQLFYLSRLVDYLIKAFNTLTKSKEEKIKISNYTRFFLTTPTNMHNYVLNN